MRCKICDWEPGAPISLYHSTLSMPVRPTMQKDPETGEMSCNCYESDVTFIEGAYRLEDIGNMEEGDSGEDG